ncbi:MAG: rhodanese family protein [Mesorhizobium sp.]|nr:MAG: rhodanese family protein [Mesorhizobium sp.]
MSHDPVVEQSALSTLPAFRLLDVRDQAAFSLGHAPNAVRVPIEVWEAAAKAGETSFENVAYWERAIGELGVDGEVPAIVYDDGRMTEAARVWFILQYFGAKAFILNGGWPAVERHDDLPGAAQAAGASAVFRAGPGAGPVGLVDRQTLKAELDGDVRIFDARTAGEYTGEDLRRNARGGHLPGARLLPHANLLDGSRLRPAAELHDLLAQAGFQSGDHIVTHCDGGGRAALAAAAAARAGYRDVRAYYLSFADWAKDESCAIIRD